MFKRLRADLRIWLTPVSPLERGKQAGVRFFMEHPRTLRDWTMRQYLWRGQDEAAGQYFSPTQRREFTQGWIIAGREYFPDLPESAWDISADFYIGVWQEPSQKEKENKCATSTD